MKKSNILVHVIFIRKGQVVMNKHGPSYHRLFKALETDQMLIDVS